MTEDQVTTRDVQIGIRAEQIDADLLKQLAVQDRTSNSAMVRRLIHEEARRRGLLPPINAESNAAQALAQAQA
jgi:hypothetical protein